MAPRRSTPRLRVVREGGGLRLESAGQRSLGGALVLAVWLLAWAAGEALVIGQLFFTESPEDGGWFLGLWLVLWTVGGIAAVAALLRSLGVRQVMAVEGQVLRWRAAPLGRARRLDLGEVRSLRVEAAVPAEEPPPGVLSEEWDPRRSGPGQPAALVFDAGGRSWRFGEGLSADELETARAALAERLTGGR